eukprot:g12007.t1
MTVSFAFRPATKPGRGALRPPQDPPQRTGAAAAVFLAEAPTPETTDQVAPPEETPVLVGGSSPEIEFDGNLLRHVRVCNGGPELDGTYAYAESSRSFHRVSSDSDVVRTSIRPGATAASWQFVADPEEWLEVARRDAERHAEVARPSSSGNYPLGLDHSHSTTFGRYRRFEGGKRCSSSGCTKQYQRADGFYTLEESVLSDARQGVEDRLHITAEADPERVLRAQLGEDVCSLLRVPEWVVSRGGRAERIPGLRIDALFDAVVGELVLGGGLPDEAEILCQKVQTPDLQLKRWLQQNRHNLRWTQAAGEPPYTSAERTVDDPTTLQEVVGPRPTRKFWVLQQLPRDQEETNRSKSLFALSRRRVLSRRGAENLRYRRRLCAALLENSRLRFCRKRLLPKKGGNTAAAAGAGGRPFLAGRGALSAARRLLSAAVPTPHAAGDQSQPPQLSTGAPAGGASASFSQPPATTYPVTLPWLHNFVRAPLEEAPGETAATATTSSGEKRTSEKRTSEKRYRIAARQLLGLLETNQQEPRSAGVPFPRGGGTFLQALLSSSSSETFFAPAPTRPKERRLFCSPAEEALFVKEAEEVLTHFLGLLHEQGLLPPPTDWKRRGKGYSAEAALAGERRKLLWGTREEHASLGDARARWNRRKRDVFGPYELLQPEVNVVNNDQNAETASAVSGRAGSRLGGRDHKTKKRRSEGAAEYWGGGRELETQENVVVGGTSSSDNESEMLKLLEEDALLQRGEAPASSTAEFHIVPVGRGRAALEDGSFVGSFDVGQEEEVEPEPPLAGGGDVAAGRRTPGDRLRAFRMWNRGFLQGLQTQNAQPHKSLEDLITWCPQLRSADEGLLMRAKESLDSEKLVALAQQSLVKVLEVRGGRALVERMDSLLDSLFPGDASPADHTSAVDDAKSHIKAKESSSKTKNTSSCDQHDQQWHLAEVEEEEGRVADRVATDRGGSASSSSASPEHQGSIPLRVFRHRWFDPETHPVFRAHLRRCATTATGAVKERGWVTWQRDSVVYLKRQPVAEWMQNTFWDVHPFNLHVHVNGVGEVSVGGKKQTGCLCTAVTWQRKSPWEPQNLPVTKYKALRQHQGHEQQADNTSLIVERANAAIVAGLWEDERSREKIVIEEGGAFASRNLGRQQIRFSLLEGMHIDKKVGLLSGDKNTLTWVTYSRWARRPMAHEIS